MRDPKNSQEPDSNHYAFPLGFSPVLDAITKRLVRIDILPVSNDLKDDEITPCTPVPPNEYLPELQKSLRSDLKPLHVVQPEGVSFHITRFGETGYHLEWQKRSFQVGFNAREGIVLYNV